MKKIMISMQRLLFLLFVILNLIQDPVLTSISSPLLKHDEPLFRIPLPTKEVIGFHAEFGSTTKGFGFGGNNRNVLTMREDFQLLIPSLRTVADAQLIGLGVNPAFTKYAPTRNTDGYVRTSGRLSEQDVTFWTKFGWMSKAIPGRFSFNFYLPLKTRKLEDISLTDLTTNVFASSRAIRDFIKNLPANAKALGGLNLEEWSASGLGDLVGQFVWDVRLQQKEDIVSFVTLYAKLGFLIPTGALTDQNNPFSLALGTDGAWGFPAGMGVEVEFVRYVRSGILVDFLSLLDTTRVRRLKKSSDQTDFLLFNKGNAVKRHGMSWQFETFLQAYKVWRGFSAEVRYQFMKHESDRLISKDPNFTNEVINTSASLKDWHLHNLMFNLSYDFSQEFSVTNITPHLSFFVRVPMAGKLSPNMVTLGGQCAICF